MKTNKIIGTMLVFGIILCGFFSSLSAGQGNKDTLNENTNNGGIPGSANTLFPNNGPEFPHSAPVNPSTDPGPFFHAPQNNIPDTIPNPQKGSHPQ